MNTMTFDVATANQQLAGNQPEEIIAWALAQASNPVVTTNFGPYEAVILHMAVQARPDIQVIWVDSGYNTSATYRFAEKLIARLKLNVSTFVPQQTAARRNVLMQGIPEIDQPLHEEFTRQVKLEPFARALAEIQPDVWFNAIRKDQTDFRQSLDIVSVSRSGIAKVAPLFNLTSADLDAYLTAHQLPDEHDYFDPTKALETRECGLHTRL
jgi:phosphoadenosine phosphosulfate reductase